MKEEMTGWKLLSVISICTISIVFGGILDGYAITLMWKWFVIEKFGMMALNIPEAIGLGLVTSILTHQTQNRTSFEEEKTWGEKLSRVVGICFFKPTIFILMGWIVRSFL